jgi:hypothetical protein
MKAISIFLLLVVASAAAFGDTITIKIRSMKDGDSTLFYFFAEGSGRVIPENMNHGDRAATAAVKGGDTLVLVNETSVFCKPFSSSLGNRFSSPQKGVPPGGTLTYVVKNTGQGPIKLTLFDEIHNRTSPITIAVLPGKSGNPLLAKSGLGSKLRLKGLHSGAWTGTWQTTYGTVTLIQAGNIVTGSSDYYSTKIDGKIGADGKLNFKWSDSNKKHGEGTFELNHDTFSGTWFYILSDGKSHGSGGMWGGRRKG